MRRKAAPGRRIYRNFRPSRAQCGARWDMQNLDRVPVLERAAGSELSIAPHNQEHAAFADAVLGRVIAVTGSQATADLTAAASTGAAEALPTIGALVGVRTAS